MANEIIRPTQLPERTDPVASEVVPSDNGATVGGVTWADGVNAAVPPASQSESEAGVINTKRMTPLTTKQAIDAQVPPKISSAIGALNLGSASQAQVEDFATAVQGAKADSAVQPSRTVGTGTGLTGGGDLSADRTISLTPGTIASLGRADSSVQTVNGNTPDGSGNVVVNAEFLQDQDSVATATMESFASTVEWVRTAGYALAGDGGGALYKRVASEPAHGGKFQSADGAWWDLAENVIRPEHFGARGDGVTDDTAAIAVADAYCRSFTPYRTLQFSTKTYLVDQMVIHIGSKWKGHGKNGTIILQQIGANKDLLYGVNSLQNYGKPAQGGEQNAEGFPYDFEIDGLTLDGNWNGGPAYAPGTPGNVSGCGIAFYGDHFIMRDIFVKNTAGKGIYTEFDGDSPINYDKRFFRSAIQFTQIDYCGEDGFVTAGPHDILVDIMEVIDAGQEAENTYDGIRCEPNTSGRMRSIHPCSRAGRRRMRHSLNIMDNSAFEFTGGCNIEGAGVTPLRLGGQNCYFDSTTRIYATFGNATVMIVGNAQRNRLHGMLDGHGATADPIGIVFSGEPSDNVTDNDIDLFCNNQNGGNVLFQVGGGEKGRNRIRLKIFNTANVSINGTPNPTSRVQIDGLVNGVSPYRFDTWDQSTNVAIPAGAEYTWTFPYPFPDFPNVQVSIGATAAVPTMPLYITALTLTSVTVRNGNSNPMPAFISAEAL